MGKKRETDGSVMKDRSSRESRNSIGGITGRSRKWAGLFSVMMLMIFLCGCGKNAEASKDFSTEPVTEYGAELTMGSDAEAETETEIGTETETESETETEEVAGKQSEKDAAKQTETPTEAEAGETAQVAEVVAEPEPAPSKQWVVCIDPGHGGEGDRNHGVEREYNGAMVMEKTLTLAIAEKIKAYLEADSNITVLITRTGDYAVGIQDRVSYAQANNADLFVSIHINSSSTGNPDDHGCLAIVTQSHYQASGAKSSDVYGDSEALARNILNGLNGLGIPYTSDFMADANNGFLRRASESGATYSDGSAADYYGIISNATKAGIPACIVEHAFLSNESDYVNFLSDDGKLDALARADAAAIQNYINSR